MLEAGPANLGRLDATGGNLSITNDATIHFLEEAREDILRRG